VLYEKGLIFVSGRASGNAQSALGGANRSPFWPNKTWRIVIASIATHLRRWFLRGLARRAPARSRLS